MTANDLITGAMRLIGVVASGQPLTPDDASVGLEALQQMVDGWNADGLAIFTTRTDDFPFVAGQQAYTLGTGGDFDMTRPAFINSMSAITQVGTPTPIEIPMDEYSVQDWQTMIPVKNVQGTFPTVWYDSADYPLRVISFWPIPQSGNSVRIYSWAALDSPADYGTDIAFPPGYAEAFKYNLAVRLSAEFAAPISPVVQAGAIESMARVKRINTPSLQLRSDLTSGPDSYNWKAEMFGIPY